MSARTAKEASEPKTALAKPNEPSPQEQAALAADRAREKQRVSSELSRDPLSLK
jgi:hypothetical protein